MSKKKNKEEFKFADADVHYFTKALGTFLKQSKATGIEKDTYRNKFSYKLSNGDVLHGGRVQGQPFTGNVFRNEIYSIHRLEINSGAEAKEKISLMFNSIK